MLPSSFWPCKHAVHTDCPVSDAFPFSHVLHSELPPDSDAKVPAPQGLQAVPFVMASWLLYFPGAQALHNPTAAAPSAALNLPFPQFLHPSPEPLPAVIWFVWIPYLPATHAVHVALPVSP